MYLYSHIHIHIRVHIIRTYRLNRRNMSSSTRHSYVHVMRVCTYSYSYIHMHMRIHMSSYIQAQSSQCVQQHTAFVCIFHMSIHMFIFVHTYSYPYTHYSYVQARSLQCVSQHTATVSSPPFPTTQSSSGTSAKHATTSIPPPSRARE